MHKECSHHHHEVATFDHAFLIAIIANGLFVILQIYFSYYANSNSLFADAIHNLGDVLGLALAWIATLLMKKKPTEKNTYGLKKISILAALTNGILLVFSCGVIVTEAVYKFFAPSEVQASYVMIVAGIGILINSSTALLFMRGSSDLNIRGAYLHLIYDALISVGVVISALILYWTHWLWVDPLVGLLIAGMILKGTWSLFSDSFRLIIDGVPNYISWDAVNGFLMTVQGVQSLHDLHIWAISTKENALSVHLYMPQGTLTDKARMELVEQLKTQFNIQHVTIQVESILSYCNDTCNTSPKDNIMEF